MTAEAILYKENDPLLRYAIYKAYKYRCAYTGKFLYDYSSMHLDHIIPQNTAPEVLQEKIRKYHLADDFTIDSLENILPTKSLHNNSQKNRHPFSEPAERFFLEYAQRGKWKIEREYKILKKQFELSKLKVFAEAQLVEFNLLPPEVYKASRKVTNSLSIHNHFWRSTENIALNGFLPSKLKEEGSCVISFCNRTIMITLDHKSILQLINKLETYSLNDIILRGHSYQNTKTFVVLGNTYKLRDYAEHICKKIYTILSNRFNPTIIEITCMDLAAKLNSIGSPTDLQNWLDVHLDKSKFVLKEQIDFLQQQIDTTIQALRDKAKLKDCTLTDTLKQVEEDLDKIRQQNKELRGAFRETKKIKNGLLDHPFRDSSDETDEKTAEAIDYFEEIRVSLDMVDSRIDRLQPKIKQFFNALNRPLFNTRVSKFLNFLLNRSSIQNNQLVLPEPVHPFVTHIPTTTFTVIQRQTELFPVHTSQSNTYTEDPQKRDKAFNAERIKLKQQNLAGLWISRIRDQRKYRKDIHLSKSFFRILDENQEDIQLGLIVIYQLIKAFDKDENWRVEIHPDELVSMPGHSFVIHDIWLKQK